MVELTHEQHEALKQNGTEPLRAIDRATNIEYVLIRAEAYERLKTILSDDLPNNSTLMNELMAEDDAKDTYLESYQHYPHLVANSG